MTVEISAIVLNYNGREILKRCLESIEKHTSSSHEVIVVDNNSHDKSQEMVKNEFPKTILIENEDNLGYTKANNIGIEKANGEFIVLMNNDIELLPGALDELLHFLKKNPQIGAAASKLVYPDYTVQGSVKNLPTISSALFGRWSFMTKIWPNNYFSRKYLIYLDNDFSKEFEVGYASTACFMIRKSALDKAGLLDEDFFMYWADADWCYRIKKAGFGVYCVPSSVAIHYEHKGGSRLTKKHSQKAVIDFNYGAYLYYRKHHIRFWWSPKHLLAITGLSMNAARLLLTGWLKSE